MPSFTVIGLRIPSADLYLPDVIVPRCGHAQAREHRQCPMCGLTADAPDGPPRTIPQFDGTRLCGYDTIKTGDSHFVGVIVGGGPMRHGIGFTLSIESFAEIVIRMKDKMSANWSKVWDKHGSSFAVWCVEP